MIFSHHLLTQTIRFCEETDTKDPKAALITAGSGPQNPNSVADASVIKTYLLWRRDGSRMKKQSSISTRWHILSQLFQQIGQRYVDEGIMMDIKNVCPRS
jgi:hypothetical protein